MRGRKGIPRRPLLHPNITQKDELFITPTGQIISFLFSRLSCVHLLVGNSIFPSARCRRAPRCCCEVPISGRGSIQLIIDLFGHVLLCRALCAPFFLRQIAQHGLGYCLSGANLLPTAATVFDEYILPLHHGFNKAARQMGGGRERRPPNLFLIEPILLHVIVWIDVAPSRAPEMNPPKVFNVSG